MKHTTNYNLNKPDPDDFYDIDDFNDNADIIDEELQNIKDMIPTIDEELSSTSENPVQNKAIYKTLSKVKANVTVPTTAWVADTTYSDYGYKADITFSGVDSNYFADVVLAPNEATSGMFAPVCLVSTNTVTIYASDAPSEDITIPLIKVVKVVTV